MHLEFGNRAGLFGPARAADKAGAGRSEPQPLRKGLLLIYSWFSESSKLAIVPQSSSSVGHRLCVDFIDPSERQVDVGFRAATRLLAAAVDATGSDGAGERQPPFLVYNGEYGDWLRHADPRPKLLLEEEPALFQALTCPNLLVSPRMLPLLDSGGAASLTEWTLLW